MNRKELFTFILIAILIAIAFVAIDQVYRRGFEDGYQMRVLEETESRAMTEAR